MQANELRIGNYFLRNNIASQVHPCIIEDVFNGKSNIEPILLTEKWLLKFGFKEFEKDCRTFFILNGLKLERSNGGHIYYKKMYISSIHQLQNLYFALKQEELIIKLE